MILQNLFSEHPHGCGETYFEHQQRAVAFGTTLVLAGIACLVHALVPAFFETTGSRAVGRLHRQMAVRRVGHTGVWEES